MSVSRSNKTIGNRLIAAIGFMAFLTIAVSLIAATNWERLNRQIETIVHQNMPTLQVSYQLERKSAGLQSELNEIALTRDPIVFTALNNKIDQHLESITAAIKKTISLENHVALKKEHEQLTQDISIYIHLLAQRNEVLTNLQQTQNAIKWLHQDLVDELSPLRQDVEWQLKRMMPTVQQDRALTEVMTEFSLIQAITIKENELHQLIEDIILQRRQRDLGNAFYFIDYKIKEITRLSLQLAHYQTTTNYRQLLKEFITLTSPQGDLQKQLRKDVDLSRKITQLQDSIGNQMVSQEELIQAMVTQADNDLNQLNKETRHTITLSNIILFGVVFLTMFISIMLSIYLVGKGIVKRLNLLSQDLTAVTNGKLDSPIQVTGDDEIGLIGNNLRLFCQQMQEMQKTNALSLINNTQASIITCNLFGTIESMNPSAQKLFQLDITDSLVQIWNLFEHDMHGRLQALFDTNSPLLNQGAFNLTLCRKIIDETIYLRLDFRIFQQGNQDKVIVTITDITEQENIARWLENMVKEKTLSLTNRNRQLKEEIEDRKRIEADLRNTQDELIQAAKMAVVGQTMTSLAHELNQPLSAISTYIFTAKMAIERENYTKLLTTIEKVDNLTSRMGRIISSLKSFSKKQSAGNALAKVEIQESINQAMMIVESRAKMQKTVINNLVPSGLFALADQVQLEQILVNLLVNSCDAVARNQHRTIDIILLSQDSVSIKLAVSDSGSGFGEDIIKKLFIPFTTTKDVGLGLGLSICRSIMTRLNGDIFLASNLNHGAMVVLELKHYVSE
ncbi:ATP-binding protein [Photobacterium damselae subsp. damselae]|uniref:ATP-binding protein n=1 Tax=Photobacterium damselae TaxID=38293 RepID=UPI00083B2C1A|nr:ATP-binding protein [Photobacterium damselae]ODA23433.1 histidine kinase [Photobacterium damselae subsp. damselae]UJZ94532.1 ATP-binding protein [Photobacterium damselae subsp. damselae]UJZ98515.1 ATP-binding protein [Photobacterium damselae subsp. damselae]UKA06951.1 ATP-binding protein [Photobacterium damselae subsp. damselae]UKA22056.1 ATP-binding protein [Photobacterium damselae subsp. damselae]